MLYYILDEEGNPVGIPSDDPSFYRDRIMDVESLLMDVERRIVAKTRHGGVLVSTVFLSIDHNYTDKGPPVLWETMVFGGRHNEECRRYTSREDAVQGHFEMVQEILDISSSWSQSISKSLLSTTERLAELNFRGSCWSGSEMSFAFVGEGAW